MGWWVEVLEAWSGLRRSVTRATKTLALPFQSALVTAALALGGSCLFPDAARAVPG